MFSVKSIDSLMQIIVCEEFVRFFTIDYGGPLYRIIVSHNDLSSVCLNHKNIQYLDISYNSNMSERVTFNPAKIDTIVREGVADGKRLLAPNAPPLPHPTFILE